MKPCLCLMVGLMLGPFASCGATALDRSGRPVEAGVCFGGRPEVFLDEVHSSIMTNPRGTRFIVVEGRVLWQWEGGIEQLDLASGERDPVGYLSVLKAADSRETFAWTWSHSSPGSRLVAIGPRNAQEPRRIVVEEEDGQASPRDSSLAIDGDFIYFASEPQPRQPGGLFRVPLHGTGLPEKLADTPAGNGIPLTVERPYIYWSQNGALSRRRIAPVGPTLQLTFTKDARVPMALHRGRLYYLDNKSLFSVPLDGSSPPAEHVTGLDADRDATVLVDHDCLYWTTKLAIMRAKLGRPGQLEPQLIADKWSYDGSPIGTDGNHLYWIDERRQHLMRAGRSRWHLR